MKLKYSLISFGVMAAMAGCGGSSSVSVPEVVVPDPPAQPEEPTQPAVFSMSVLDTALAGEVVHEVRQVAGADAQEWVIAATNNGIYLKADERWALITPETWEVLDFYEIDNEHWLASIRDNGTGSFSVTRLVETFDGGERWGIVDNNFGGSAELTDETQEPVYRITADETGERLYAVGVGVLAESLDFGINWQAISGFWGSFGSGLDSVTYVASSPVDGIAKTVFYGGQGAIENPILNRFDITESNPDAHSTGEETLMDVSVEELLPVPSVVKSIVPLSEEIGSYLVTGEGGIITTPDNGENWQPVLTNPNSRFYFDVLIHPDNADFWVTAGWNKNFDTEQPLIVEITRDGGQTWESAQWSGDDDRGVFGGVFSMSWAKPDENTVYFGTVNGGVYTVQLQL